ncbi:hypothetical protein WICMUC_000548 [Wickerhamomyces mucosus]|uniref:Proteasome assembly chaperone 3 n=1 Tax=Wickerhamomyces mucosus TaxID=1378264 RepID=A0A9P8PX53_9ASCO|nr:hypothetical protein WICMUC_000548 [Wickerhamomyces mucosus]
MAPNKFQSNETSDKIDQQNELTVQIVDFADKKVVFIRFDGEIDTTFDVKAPDSRVMFELVSNPEMEDFMVEKQCLIGNNTEVKLSVVINQVAKLLYGRGETRNLVISLSSKIFARDDGKDFDKIIMVLNLLKQLT